MVRTSTRSKAATDSAISAAINTTTAALTNQINQRATTSAVNALTSRVTSTEAGIVAVSDSIDQVSVITNEASASGRLRVSAFGVGADVGARIGISARADAGQTAAQASLFIEALSNGNSRVNVVASQFAIVNSAANNPVRSVPFYVQSGSVYMDTAIIREATIDTLHLANGAVVAGYTTTLSGANPSWNTNAEIARFTINLQEAYRGLLFLECTGITRQDWTAQAAVGVQLNSGGVRRSISTVLPSPVSGGAAYVHDEDRAVAVVPVNLAQGNNILRLWGRNVTDVSYLLDVLTFKR